MHIFTEKLDRSIPIPLYFQLKSILLEDIKDGSFSEGDTIPTEIELVDFYQISRSTVRQAISELVQEGWLIRKASKGTFVTKANQTASHIRSFEPFYQQVNRLGKTLRTELIDLSVNLPTAEIAKVLNLKPGQKIISMFRKRFVDDLPMVTLQNYLPYDLCSFVLAYDFREHSLYELFMQNQKTRINNTHTVVSALSASPEDVKLLNVKPTAPMLCFNNISTTEDGIVIDYAFSRYRGDFNKFEFDDSPKIASTIQN